MTTAEATSVRAPLYVAGEWRPASGDPIAVVNPYDESVLAEVPSASAGEVSDAIGAAYDARAAWARRSYRERSAPIRLMAALVEEHRDEFADLLVAEVGKPRKQALGEVQFTIDYFAYVAEWDRRIEGEIVPSDTAGESIHLLRIPYGVVAAICPWNFPLVLYARKAAPALLTGNTIVVKPSEVTPMTSLRLTELIDEHAGLPPGVLNVVTGAGEVGQALVDDPRVALVSMTGHRDTGKKVMERASKNLTRVSLELGGKAPLIVWSDADLELAIEACISARHTNSGQVCTSAERVFVHRDVADDFTAGYVEAARALRMGDPRSDDVDLGPLVSAQQLEKATGSLELARSEGAELLLEGGVPESGGPGYWFSPVVLGGIEPKMTVMREETFAPITPIMPIDSLGEALAQANESRYGLSAYLFTNDYSLVMQAAEQLEFGELFVNRTLGEAVQAHHIGHKESGFGGEDGKYGVLKYTQLKSVYHRFA